MKKHPTGVGAAPADVSVVTSGQSAGRTTTSRTPTKAQQAALVEAFITQAATRPNPEPGYLTRARRGRP